MMNTSFKLSIGMQGSAANPDPSSYTRVTLDAQFHKQKIQQFTKQMREKLGKYRVPTLIFDFPESIKHENLGIFHQLEKLKFFESKKNGRIYKCLEITEEEFLQTKKKFEKVFGKLTELDNKLFLHLDLYNVDTFHERFMDKDHFPISTVFQKAKIEGNFCMDDKFCDALRDATMKIAPKFAESPLLSLLPLLCSLECDIEMDSLSELEPEHQEQLFGFKRFEEPDDDEEGKNMKQDFKNKDKVCAYVCFDTLGFVKVQLEVRMLALYNCLC